MAEHRYARLTETINVSEDYADLANEDPLAAVVYMMTWTKCWPWAILPGKPLEFKATVCPGLDISRERMQDILDVLDRRGCIVYYEAPDGTPLRFSCQWHKHNPVKWQMVSLPKHAPPPSWTPPVEFVAWVSAHPQDTMAKWLRSQEVTNGYNWLQRYPTEARGGAEGGQRDLAVAVEVDVTTTTKDSAPPAADATPKRTRTKTETDLCYEACLAVFGISADALDKAQWATYAKAMNSLVGQVSLEQLQAWAEQEGANSRMVGTGAKPQVRVPMVVRKEVTAGEWQASFAKTRERSGTNTLFVTLSDGTRSHAKDWDEFSEFPGIITRETGRGNWNKAKGVTKTPVVGMVCEDGWAYTSGGRGEDGQYIPKRTHEVPL